MPLPDNVTHADIDRFWGDDLPDDADTVYKSRQRAGQGGYPQRNTARLCHGGEGRMLRAAKDNLDVILAKLEDTP